MKYYKKYVYKTQKKSYESSIKNHNYLDEPLLLGAAEVTKHWDLLNIAPFSPYIEWLRHDDFNQFDDLQWNVFAIEAVEQMKKSHLIRQAIRIQLYIVIFLTKTQLSY